MPCEQSILDLGLGNFGYNPSKSKRSIYKFNYRTRRKKILPKPTTDGQLWFDFEGPRETTGTENLHHFEETAETNETEDIHHNFASVGSRISNFLNSIKKWFNKNFISSIIMIFLALLSIQISIASYIANNKFNNMFINYIVDYFSSFYKNQIIIIENQLINIKNQHDLLLIEEQNQKLLKDLKSKIAELENRACLKKCVNDH